MKTPLLFFLSLQLLFSANIQAQSVYPKHLRVVSGVSQAIYGQVCTPIAASHALAFGNSRFNGFFSGDGIGAPSLSRIDSSGTPVWSKTLSLIDIGSTHGSVVFSDAKTGVDKQVVAIGNTGVQYAANYQFQYGTGFVLKLDVNGTVIWSRKLQDPSVASFEPLGVDVCPDSGLVICGRTITSYTTSNLDSKSFIARLDKNGNLLWMKRDTTQQYTIAESVVFTGDSGYYMLGSKGTSTLSTPTVWRVNTAGNFMWTKTYCLGTSCGKGYSIEKMSNGLLCLAAGSDLQLFKIGYSGQVVFSKRYIAYVRPGFTIEELRPKLRAIQSNQFLISNSGQFMHAIVVDATGQVKWAASTANLAEPTDVIQLNNKDFLFAKNEAFLNIVFLQKDSLMYGNTGFIVTDSLGSGAAKCYTRSTFPEINTNVVPTTVSGGLQSIGTLTAFQATIAAISFTAQEGCMGIAIGIAEQNILQVKLYPNPAGNQIFLEADNFDLENCRFILSDLQGKQVLNKTLEPKENGATLNLDELPAGVYFYRLQTADKRFKVGKLIIAQVD